MIGGVMSGYFQAFELEDLEKKQAEVSGPYLEFLRRRGMSAGLYMLPVGGEDHQHPHAADEMYIVLRGSAKLRVGDREHAVRQGSVVSVDHGEDHNFFDITEDLSLLVVFAPPEDPEGESQGSAEPLEHQRQP
jgi:mannose-6-phosphate isomerase-like protein (cupin superfamily)